MVGGGPAGLTAAVYLARFRRKFLLIDAGESRALRIPRTRNLSGFPEGINGREFLRRLRQQARNFDAEMQAGKVSALSRDGNGFLAEANGKTIEARAVLLATGVINFDPPMNELDRAIAMGAVRYCPVCDGYEASGRNIAVLGGGAHAVEEAIFLRTYSADITFLSLHGAAKPPPQALEDGRHAGVRIIGGEIARLQLNKDKTISANTIGGEELRFDTLYCALGTEARHRLASMLGVELFKNNCIRVDAHMRASVEGLYAAGDVIEGLDQISAAIGNAAIAATTIHNALNE
ncbi:MAG TPA: NAD(P)/FAD-dependent oxidoreductase [Xanthobacteraceae bacterium]|nr:NAD(P)/FAD-dependent oxidoreductase [Xanthobacteraceae bacterium]